MSPATCPALPPSTAAMRLVGVIAGNTTHAAIAL